MTPDENTKPFWEMNTESGRLIMQVVNCTGFVIAMFLNFVAPFLTGSFNEEDFTADRENVRILLQPAGYAFSIWFVIYSLCLVFVVYQALPDAWVQSRNNELIFDKIGWLFFANMILNGLWLLIFSKFSTFYYILGGIDIVALLATSVIIMMITSRAEKMNIVEFIGLNCGFSIYAGWLTAATILNFAIILKDLGLSDTNNIYPSEEVYTMIILVVAFIVYATASVLEKNPIFGSVYVWVLVALIA